MQVLQSTCPWIFREQKRGLGMFLSAGALAWDVGDLDLSLALTEEEREEMCWGWQAELELQVPEGIHVCGCCQQELLSQRKR